MDTLTNYFNAPSEIKVTARVAFSQRRKVCLENWLDCARPTPESTDILKYWAGEIQKCNDSELYFLGGVN